MKKLSIAAIGLVALTLGSAYAKEIRDWKDIDEVHRHVEEAIHEMERAAGANHYDMDGHAKRAEELLRQAEHELHDAVESARHEH